MIVKKKMKMILYVFLTTLLCIGFINTRAQEKKGLYLSWKDYNEGKLLTSASGTCKINKHPFFHSGYIDLVTTEKKYRYAKDSLFGYTDGKSIYRLNQTDKEEYLIAEHREIMIYVLCEPHYGSKNFILVPHFYFSRDAASPIIPLSLINLKRTFPDDLGLQHSLDLAFYGNDVAAYDEEHNMFKINYLLKQLNQSPKKVTK